MIRLGSVCLFNHLFWLHQHKWFPTWTETGLLPGDPDVPSSLLCVGLRVTAGLATLDHVQSSVAFLLLCTHWNKSVLTGDFGGVCDSQQLTAYERLCRLIDASKKNPVKRSDTYTILYSYRSLCGCTLYYLSKQITW